MFQLKTCNIGQFVHRETLQSGMQQFQKSVLFVNLTALQDKSQCIFAYICVMYI
jgi:hypothetical protein